MEMKVAVCRPIQNNNKENDGSMTFNTEVVEGAEKVVASIGRYTIQVYHWL